MFEINLFNQIREEVEDDFYVLSKIFHKRVFSFFINYEAVRCLSAGCVAGAFVTVSLILC